MKLPFALYKAIHGKKRLTLVFNFLILLFGIYAIFSILSTRGAILGILLTSLLLLGYMIIIFIRKAITTRVFLKRILIIILPLIINVLIKKNSIAISNSGELNPLNDKIIFERFEKNGTNSNSVGLGLSIVKEIAEVYNINISYSYENKLHVFTLHQLA